MSSVSGFKNEVMGIQDKTVIPGKSTVTRQYKRECGTKPIIEDKNLPNLATSFENFESQKKSHKINIIGFEIDYLVLKIMITSVILISIFLYIDKTLSNPSNKKTASLEIILLSSAVFGFIDNYALFIGVDGMELFIQKFMPGADFKSIAGLANTYSTIMAIFLYASITSIISKSYAVNILPTTSQYALGVSLGSLLPVLFHNVGFI